MEEEFENYLQCMSMRRNCDMTWTEAWENLSLEKYNSVKFAPGLLYCMYAQWAALYRKDDGVGSNLHMTTLMKNQLRDFWAFLCDGPGDFKKWIDEGMMLFVCGDRSFKYELYILPYIEFMKPLLENLCGEYADKKEIRPLYIQMINHIERGIQPTPHGYRTIAFIRVLHRTGKNCQQFLQVDQSDQCKVKVCGKLINLGDTKDVLKLVKANADKRRIEITLGIIINKIKKGWVVEKVPMVVEKVKGKVVFKSWCDPDGDVVDALVRHIHYRGTVEFPTDESFFGINSTDAFNKILKALCSLLGLPDCFFTSLSARSASWNEAVIESEHKKDDSIRKKQMQKMWYPNIHSRFGGFVKVKRWADRHPIKMTHIGTKVTAKMMTKTHEEWKDAPPEKVYQELEDFNLDESLKRSELFAKNVQLSKEATGKLEDFYKMIMSKAESRKHPPAAQISSKKDDKQCIHRLLQGVATLLFTSREKSMVDVDRSFFELLDSIGKSYPAQERKGYINCKIMFVKCLLYHRLLTIDKLKYNETEGKWVFTAVLPKNAMEYFKLPMRKSDDEQKPPAKRIVDVSRVKNLTLAHQHYAGTNLMRNVVIRPRGYDGRLNVVNIQDVDKDTASLIEDNERKGLKFHKYQSEVAASLKRNSETEGKNERSARNNEELAVVEQSDIENSSIALDDNGDYGCDGSMMARTASKRPRMS